MALRNIDEFNECGSTGIIGIMIVLTDRMNEAVKAAMIDWRDDDPRDTYAYASFGASAQSESTYWTVGDDTFEYCVRLSAHKAVACCSKVDRNVNIADYVTIETDAFGDEHWFIDYEAACAAVDNAAVSLLGKI